jgi:hypothetical protein
MAPKLLVSADSIVMLEWTEILSVFFISLSVRKTEAGIAHSV